MDGVSKSAGGGRIEEARAIASERGGEVLAAMVPNGLTLLSWRCAEGHVWKARLVKVKGGNWCPTCAGRGPVTIEDMRQLAAERLGKCLSTEYVNNDTRLLWRCVEAHEWWAKPAQIRRTWCPTCAKCRKLEIADLRRVARARGGVLVSDEYVNNMAPLLWRCHEGHLWEAAASSVKPGKFSKGTWCPCCPQRHQGRPARLTIEEMQALAIGRGGLCLSKHYVNSVTPLEWRCGQGHEWKAKPAFVKYGTWCPVCGGKQKLSLEDLRDLARERSGELLSTEYVSGHSPLCWRCEEGHEWDAGASKVKQGNWCPTCAGKKRLTIEEMQALAEARGGQCLSKRYVNRTTPLRWRCAEGHTWRALPNMVKPVGYQEKGTWCPVCADAPKYSLEEMQALAAAQGGECLSRKYVNADVPLLWRCAKGHTWKSAPIRMRLSSTGLRGPTWCAVCARDKRKLTIEQMRELAASRGGECLSKAYVNSRTPLLWRCSAGHEWAARPNHIQPTGPDKKSSWCPVCQGRSPRL